MRAVDVLVKEHDAILWVVAAAKREAAKIAKSGRVDGKRIREMIAFFQGFVDRCHHAKEERVLFPALEARGVPRYMGPIGCMVREHGLGRGEVEAMSAALEAYEEGRKTAAATLARHLAWYADLLTAHIERENEVLFKMGDRVLSAKDQAVLVDGFAAAEKDEMDKREYNRYTAWARGLRRPKRPAARKRAAKT